MASKSALEENRACSGRAAVSAVLRMLGSFQPRHCPTSNEDAIFQLISDFHFIK
jgi:hypothetical protein